MTKRTFFRTLFSSERANGSRTLLKSAQWQFCPIVSSFWDKLSWKTSLWIRFEILGLFVKTVTTSDKYSRHKWENFLQFKNNFLKSASNFEHLVKKDEPHSLSFSKVIDSKRRGYLYKRACFRRSFDRHPVSGSQKLLRSAGQHFYPIVLSVWDKFWKYTFDM